MSLATWPEVVLAGQPLDGTRHVCALVRSGEILEDPRVSLVGEGLARGERVISIIDDANRPELIGALEALAVNVAAVLDSRQLVVQDWKRRMCRTAFSTQPRCLPISVDGWAAAAGMEPP